MGKTYRPQQFINEIKGIDFLFELYDMFVEATLAVAHKKKLNELQS